MFEPHIFIPIPLCSHQFFVQVWYFDCFYTHTSVIWHCFCVVNTTVCIFMCGIHSDDIWTLPDLHSRCVWKGLAPVEFCASYNWVYVLSNFYVYIQGSPNETHTSTHSNLISCGMTTLLPLLSPSSILVPPLSHYAFIPARKNLAHISHRLFIFSSTMCSHAHMWIQVTWRQF